MVSCCRSAHPFSGSSSGDDPGSGGGATDGNTSGSGWNDESSGTLWNWLSGVVSGLETVWQAIVNLPSKIGEVVTNALKAIFVPDTGYIDSAFSSFLEEIKMKFSFDTDFFESLFQGESAVEDTTVDYAIPGVGSFNLKVFDSKYFVQGITYFRPFIRGFIVLLLALYNIKQLIGFFGYDAGVVTGRNDHIKSARESQRE